MGGALCGSAGPDAQAPLVVRNPFWVQDSIMNVWVMNKHGYDIPYKSIKQIMLSGMKHNTLTANDISGMLSIGPGAHAPLIVRNPLLVQGGERVVEGGVGLRK